MPLRVVDLFCGMGGFSLGAEAAGAQVVLAVDSWPAALAVHALNHPRSAHALLKLGGSSGPGSLGNVAALIARHVPAGGQWHLHGSPPCQNLSVANAKYRDAAVGKRLVVWFLRLVQLCRPTSWSMEQVPGALRVLPRPERFPFCRVVELASLGLPQLRRRLYVGAGWTLPAHPPPDLARQVLPWVQRRGAAGTAELAANSVAAWLPALAKEGTHLSGYTKYVKDRANKPVAPLGAFAPLAAARGTGRPVERGAAMPGLRPLRLPAYTLCAQPWPLKLFRAVSRPVAGGIGARLVRPLTVAEMLVLQGFPAEYRFPEATARGTRFRMIGNSLSPLVAALIVASASRRASG
jgi:site-specific DNA-cytosine methylase